MAGVIRMDLKGARRMRIFGSDTIAGDALNHQGWLITGSTTAAWKCKFPVRASGQCGGQSHQTPNPSACPALACPNDLLGWRGWGMNPESVGEHPPDLPRCSYGVRRGVRRFSFVPDSPIEKRVTNAFPTQSY
jgi:hypothetical protein